MITPTQVMMMRTEEINSFIDKILMKIDGGNIIK